MKKQELVSILITFVVGFFAGGYLYLNVFTQMIQPDGDIVTIEETRAFSITSQAYGGCRGDCPAFRIEADGSYRYQFSPAAGAEPLLRSGTLPLSIQSNLKRSLTERELEEQSVLVPASVCASATDGIDIRYTIELEGESYLLDSCGTNIEDQSDAWQALSRVWTYFTEVSRQ